MDASNLEDRPHLVAVLPADCWSLPLRSEDGQLQPDPERFPSGMKALADYVHGKGLKFGIYGDSGYLTCAGRAGSFGHERDDARLFASWGVGALLCIFKGFGLPRLLLGQLE